MSKHYKRSFGGGEVSPQMEGRVDDPKRQNGVRRMLNWLSRPSGAVSNRVGTEFVRDTKYSSTKRARLLPFVYSNDQALVVETGEGYDRFHSLGATVLQGTPAAFVTTKLVAAYDFALKQIDTTLPHGLTTGDEVIMGGTPGAVLPTGLAFYVPVFAIVVDPDTIAVASSLANALVGTRIPIALGASSGSHFVSRAYRTRSLVSSGGANYYCQTYDSLAGTVPSVFPPATISAAANVITLVAHGFLQGTAIVCALNGGTLPPEIVPGTTYWAIPLTANTFSISATYSTTVLTFAGSSTGSPTVVRFVHWYAEPVTGEYEIPNPYVEAELREIGHAQSFDVMTRTHTNKDEAELRRFGATSWDHVPIVFGAAVATPANVVVTPFVGETFNCTGNPLSAGAYKIQAAGSPAVNLVPGQVVFGAPSIGSPPFLPAGYAVVSHVGPITSHGQVFNTDEFGLMEIIGGGQLLFTPNQPFTLRPVSLVGDDSQTYKVTAIDANGIESLPSPAVTATNNLTNRGARNQITWSAVAGATAYKVYKEESGNWGLIGQTESLFFNDDNVDGRTIAADMGRTSPYRDTTLDGVTAGNNAGAVGYHESRRIFAGILNLPLVVMGSRSSTESDFSYHLPTVATDRLRFTIKVGDPSRIRHVVSMSQLLLFTGSAELIAQPIDTQNLQAGSVQVQRQSDIGAAFVRPIVVNNVIVFVGARDYHVYEYAFNEQRGGFTPGDLSVRATHLFDELQIVDSTFTKAPYPILWFVSSNGKLLSFTYVPQEQVGSWAQHDLGGEVESCCAIPEGNEDRLYVIVKRTIGGVVKRYIERLASLRTITSIADAHHLDSGVFYNGAPTTVVTGLAHLNGMTVGVLADGVVLAQRVVSGGQITLTKAASKVHVGLPMVAEIETLSAAFEAEAAGQGARKSAGKIWFQVTNSARFSAGPRLANMKEVMDLPIDSLIPSKEAQVLIPGDWTDGGRVLIRQTNPLPTTIVSMTQEMASTSGGSQ